MTRWSLPDTGRGAVVNPSGKPDMVRICAFRDGCQSQGCQWLTIIPAVLTDELKKPALRSLCPQSKQILLKYKV